MTTPLPELQQLLRELLVDDLAAAIKLLQAQLPTLSPKQDEILLLLGRYNDTRRRERQGGTDNDEIRRLDSQVRRDFLAIVSELRTADFEAPKSTGSNTRQGQLLYRIPHRMPLAQETKCVVRIALDEAALLEDFRVDEHTVQKVLKKYSQSMQVELSDPSGGRNFSIRPDSRTVQSIDLEGVEKTEWRFYVTPLREGQYIIEVKVAIIELVDGEKVIRERVLEEEVQIVAENPPPAAAAQPLKNAGVALAFAGTPDAVKEEPTKRASNDPIKESVVKEEVSEPEATNARPYIPAPSKTGTKEQAAPAPVSAAKGGKSSKGMRAMALFLAFLVLSTATTWAITPPDTRDYWKARIQNTEQAYTAYVEQHPASTYREKVLYRRAKVTEKPALVQEYLQEYTPTKATPEWRREVTEKLETLEVTEMQVLQQNPAPVQIEQFLRNFPETKRLPQLVQIAESKPETAPTVLPLIEQTAVQQVRSNPTTVQVRQFVQAFPQTNRLVEVKQIVQHAPQTPAADKNAAVETLAAAAIVQARRDPSERRVLSVARDFKESRAAVAEARKMAEANPRIATKVLHEVKAAEQWQAQHPAATTQAPAVETKTAPTETTTDKTTGAKTLKTEPTNATNIAANPTPPAATTPQTATAPAENPAPPPAATNPDHNQRSGLEMVRVQGGNYTMGDGKNGNNCPHPVTVATFSIGRYEVTHADWRAVMGNNPSEANKNCDQCPVDNVSWDDIQGFLKKLNTTLSKGKKPYRLPTEEEWEYAARGGKDSKGYEYAGSNDLDAVAWNDGNADSKTHPVGSLKANELGIFDMTGNVWEWCQDNWGPYPCDTETKVNKDRRVLRGGSWSNDNNDCRVANRNDVTASYHFNYFGLRLAQD